MKTIIQYLKATYILNIKCSGDEGDLIIRRLIDFDWIGDHTLKKLISGFIFILNRDQVN